MPVKKDFVISNPSGYPRDDYVELDLNSLEVPTGMDENSLRLFRQFKDGTKLEIPYQIDYILGKDKGRRFLTFYSENTSPSGTDRYDKISERFSLEEGNPQNHLTPDIKKNLWVEHFYKDNISEGNRRYHEGSQIIGVKLNNKRIRFFLCLVPYPGPGKKSGINYAGAVTNLELKDLSASGAFSDEMLAFDLNYAPKRWGQLTQIAFCPLPWQLEDFEEISLLDKKCELVYSKSGPIRAVITLKVGPLTVICNGKPLFNTGPVEIKCYIYRIIYVYKDGPFYTEELIAETCEGTSMSFRPYFSSLISYPSWRSELKRFEEIPDYFSIWKYFAEQNRGFGFAADAHVRHIQLDGDELRWRLPFSHHNKCIHYFMYHGYTPNYNIDLFHAIGHNGWYERVFKPLELTPYRKRFPAPRVDDYERGEKIF
jgi:hypothetical protein